MKRTKQLLGAVSGIALIALSTAPAYAAGTTAGDSIVNTVSVDYDVGGFDQTDVTATDTITVDRKIDLTVVESGFIGQTSTAPNATQVVTQFTVTNASNDVADFALTAVAASGNDFVLTNIKIYSDAALTNEITFLDEVAVDAAGAQIVYVAADIPATATNGQTANVVLTASAHEGGAVGLGTVYDAANTSDNTEANTAGVDTVLADIATSVGGVTDVASDGTYSAIDGYVIADAALSVVKQSRIISDPVNGSANPKAIPGAIVEYCILVANGTGSANADATSVIATDTLPADVELVASSLRINGSVTSPVFAGDTLTSGVCAADGVVGGTETLNTFPTQDAVSATLGDTTTVGTVESGEIFTLYFNATIR